MLGGCLTDTAGWRWIFLVNVPFGIVALAFGLRYLREHTEPPAGRFDVPGFVLSGFGLASITYALSEGPRNGWTNPWVLGLGISGAVAFALLVYVETHRPAHRCSPCGCSRLRGLDPFESGLTTFPQAIGILISSQIAGRIYPRIGPRLLIVGGMLGAAATMRPRS